MEAPPVLAGAVQVRAIEALPAVAVSPVGAPATVMPAVGVTGVAKTAAVALDPIALIAFSCTL